MKKHEKSRAVQAERQNDVWNFMVHLIGERNRDLFRSHVHGSDCFFEDNADSPSHCGMCETVWTDIAVHGEHVDPFRATIKFHYSVMANVIQYSPLRNVFVVPVNFPAA